MRPLLVLLGGCSFAFVSGPPKGAPPTAPYTESRVAPIVDAVIAAGLVAGGIAGVAAQSKCTPTSASDCSMFDYSSDAQTAGGVALLGGLVWAISAFHGFSATSDCRTLHAQHG
jgi:hypothetical protein